LQAKKNLSKDLRYVAIGSSSSREELFDTFFKEKIPRIASDKTLADISSETTAGAKGADSEPISRQERREIAVKEREAKISIERRRLGADIERSKQGIDKEEGERTFMCA